MAKFKGKILGCQECGREFKVPLCRSKTAKYCSRKCADVHTNDGKKVEKVTKECLRCGKTFYEYPCHADRRRYCSYKCLYERHLETRLCAYCQEPFHIYPSVKSICCSMECRSARSKSKDWPTWKKVLRQCEQCGKEFWKKPSDVKKFGGRYCSQRCGYDAHILPVDKFDGYSFYGSTHWKNIRKKVLERDNKRCQICGFAGRSLHIHHRKDRRNGGVDEMDNLTSLCNRCHRLEHWK